MYIVLLWIVLVFFIVLAPLIMLLMNKEMTHRDVLFIIFGMAIAYVSTSLTSYIQ